MHDLVGFEIRPTVWKIEASDKTHELNQLTTVLVQWFEVGQRPCYRTSQIHLCSLLGRSENESDGEAILPRDRRWQGL